jgi:peptide/nickel transport system substrate-binding protein
MKNIKWLAIAILVVAGLLMTACAGATPEQVVVTVEVPGEGGEVVVVTATPAPEATEAPVEAAFKDEPYRVGIFSDITTLNYWGANGPDNTVWNSYVLPPRLSLYGLSDVRFQIIPSLAAEMPAPLTQEGDFWVVEIPLRQDVMWSDGQPVTAEDVAFTANTALKFGLIAGNWSSWFDAGFLDHVEAVDDYTVKIVYHTKPGLARHEYGTLGAPILCAHFWQPLVDEAAAPIDALGENPSEEDLAAAQAEAQNNLYAIQPDGEPLAGSFLFSKWEAGAFAENTYNPDFFGTGTVITEYSDMTYQEVQGDRELMLYGEGTGDITLQYTVGPWVSSVVYTIYGSQDAAVLALKAGEIDFVLNPLGLQRGLRSQVEGDPNLTVIENPTNGFRYMTFNTRRQPMGDVAFRQAVAVLIDKEFVTRTILQGVAFPLYTFVPEANAAWYFDDVPKFGLKEDGTGMTREERVNEAVRILTEAGYSWEGGDVPVWDAANRSVDPGGRLILPNGARMQDITLLAPSAGYDPLRSTFAIWIETWLREAGIPVTANLTGFNVIVQKMFTEQDFDLAILGWSLSIFPSYLRDFFHSDQAVIDGNNAGGYSNPEFDALADQLLTCETFEACKEISDQIQIMLATELPYVLLFDTGIVEVYNSSRLVFPYTSTLAGLQSVHQGGGGMQSAVFIK